MIKKKSLLNYCGLLGVVAFLSYTAAVVFSPLAYPGYCYDNDGVYTGDRNSYCIRNRQGYERKYVSHASQYRYDIFKRFRC